jgi:hypothetical protein
LCENGGESRNCGKQNPPIEPDGTYLMEPLNQTQNWFCAATASGEYPVDRSLFNVRMGYKPGDLEPHCCIAPKSPHLSCENGGTNNTDGSCDCSTAFVTLTDCHGGLVNYSGDGTNNPNINGQKFNLNYSGKICDIAPTKLPDNFVKYFYYDNSRPEDYKECKITGPNSNCNGDTTTCTVNEYGTWNKTYIGGTICGDNNSQNNRDHQCGQYN